MAARIVIRPEHPLWGKETELALANFPVSGRPLPIEIVHALADIKVEAALVNLDLMVEPTSQAHERAEAISTAARAVAAGDHDDQFMIDIFQTGSGTSTNMNVNEVVANLATRSCGLEVHPNDHVNASQSSNDTFPTAVTIAAVRQIDRALVPAVRQLVESLEGAALRFAHVVKAGRTHMMDAVPIMLSDEFNGYAAQLHEALERIDAAAARIGRVPLGGTAVGNGLNAPPTFGAAVVARIAARYDISLTVAPDRFASQAGRDSVVETSSLLRGLAVSLIKIANDIRLMGSGPMTGLGELRLPELQAGSSIMPGKVNPVMCEMVTQVGAQVIGHDATIGFAASQGQFELNTYQPVMAADLLDSIHLLSQACVLFATQCIDGLEADEQRCRFFADSTPALATGLNAALGYDHVAKIVKSAVAQRRPLIDMVVDDGALDREAASEVLDPVAVARGNRPRSGGPAGATVSE
ncbi:MAG: class II fumarate hydratase [Ilumatobacteraceae bacterium]